MLMVDSQGDNIRVSRGGEWCYNISTPEYPRVAGAQLINHFVSGGVRYHIHIREQKDTEGGGERGRESRWITPMRIVFRDSHSRIVDGSTGIIVTPVEWASYDTQRRFPPWWFGCSARMGRTIREPRPRGMEGKIISVLFSGLFDLACSVVSLL